MKIKLLALFLVSLSTFCFAQGSFDKLECDGIGSLVSDVDIINVQLSQDTICSRLNQMYLVLDEVSQLFNSSLRTPVKLLYISNGHIGSYSSPNWIFISQNLEMGLRKISNEEYNTIIAHEYGHHYFFQSVF